MGDLYTASIVRATTARALSLILLALPGLPGAAAA
jgi:hypothetical protein